MMKENWCLDCNQFEPMPKTGTIIRDCLNDDNGVGSKLMMIGLNQINSDIKAGIPDGWASLICATPNMYNAINTVIEGINYHNKTDLDWIVKTLEKSLQYVYMENEE